MHSRVDAGPCQRTTVPIILSTSGIDVMLSLFVTPKKARSTVKRKVRFNVSCLKRISIQVCKDFI